MTEAGGVLGNKNQESKEEAVELNLNEKENSNNLESVGNLDINLKEKKTENKEKTMETIKNWVEQYLNENVLDEYALSYEKSKKTKEQKRQNKKYQKYLKKAHEELKPRLVELLEEKVEEGLLRLNETKQKVILEIIETTLNSDMHANTLLKAMKKHLEKNQMEDSVEIENLDSQEKEISQDEQKSSMTGEDQVTKKEAEGSLLTNKKRKSKSNKDQLKAPQTEKEFFDIYQNQKGTYLNVIDGSEFKILKYDPENREVYINKYQSFVYNQETESWSPAEKKNEERVLSYEDFLELIKGYIFDSEEDFLESFKKEEKVSEKKLNKNEKQELSEKEKVIIEVFNKYLEAKKKIIKKEVQNWHKSEEGGYMSTFTCNSVAYDLENKFLKEELPEKIEIKFQENKDKFKDVSLNKILNYFQNLVKQKEKTRETF